MLTFTKDLEGLILEGLKEDIGNGDITTGLIVGNRTVYRNAKIVAKEDIILAGVDLFIKTFSLIDSNIRILESKRDGETIKSGQIIAVIHGNIKALLLGERTALNLLQHLCGIATHTNRFVERLKGTKIKVTDTRKTTPLHRKLEKYAVKVGGGINHRGSLSEGILIKENHIVVAGSITDCVKRINRSKPHLLKIEVEVTTLEEVNEALDNNVDVIMLDNMSLDLIKKASRIIGSKALIELSGGITLNNIDSIKECPVDYISTGALTHSSKASDISFLITR